MNSDYVLKGRGQLALHKPDWASAVAVAPTSPERLRDSAERMANKGAEAARQTNSDFAAAVDAHDAAYKAAKDAHGAHKKASRYAKAEAITEQLNKSSQPSARSDVKPQETSDEDAAPQPSEISQDGSLYPERNKNDGVKMNAFNHSGANKKTVGPDVDTVDYSFEDFIDTINPLQQIPVVNMIYRHVSGDEISGHAKVMGSALYWGPMGVVTGAIDAMFEQEKGGDVGQTVIAGLLGVDTPNAHKLPSNQIKAQETMLASAAPEENIAIKAANTHRVAAKAAPAKQPFGGVMGNETPVDVANNTAHDDADMGAVDEATARKIAGAQQVKSPLPHGPVEADGHKMYSLAGVARHPSIATHMPARDVPDVRLKTYGKEIAKSASAAPQMGSMKDGAGLLGLTQPSAAIAAAPANEFDIPATRLPDPGFTAPLQMPAANSNVTTGGNPIPAQLIQDMMLMNMQKYQDMKGGTSRGASLDING
ncbi:MAG: hypothetical protein SFW65_00500 [Alphaproteobacteria bacterium]|nr:hypothetical protein [Alphaproteobacteria bacterium]